MKILLISDIHGNFPALQAIADHFSQPFDFILNGGDTTVYAPFPNQTIDWLRANKAVSILGNTDRHVITLLQGKTFRKPGKAEKRIMYGWTAAELSDRNAAWLQEQPESRVIDSKNLFSGNGKKLTIGMFHGSPDDPDEFLFADTPKNRFQELAASSPHTIITIGHSHSPFHKKIAGVHFINPGSVGRMFDGNPSAGCAVIEIGNDGLTVNLYRIEYSVQDVTTELHRLRFPPIYSEMYRQGRKLN